MAKQKIEGKCLAKKTEAPLFYIMPRISFSWYPNSKLTQIMWSFHWLFILPPVLQGGNSGDPGRGS